MQPCEWHKKPWERRPTKNNCHVWSEPVLQSCSFVYHRCLYCMDAYGPTHPLGEGGRVGTPLRKETVWPPRPKSHLPDIFRAK